MSEMCEMETNANQKVSCMVNYVYEASETDELTIRPGDVLRDVERLAGGWWRGELRGRRGMFPDNFVSVITETNNARGGGVQGRCRAVFSYQPANPDELPLSVGDVLEVLGEVEEGWWQGKRQGRVGVFPSNFVVMLDPPAPATPVEPAPALPPKPVKEQCRVLFPYQAVNEDELTLSEGDIVTIVCKEAPDRGWWRGEIHGRVGLFPDNFVQMLPTDAKRSKRHRKKATALNELQPKLPEKIQRKISEKRKLRKLWQRSRCPTVKRELNAISSKIKEELREWRVATGVVEEKKPDRPPSKTASPIYPVLNKYSEKTASVKELTTSKISTHKESTLSKETNTQTTVTNSNKSESEKFIHSETVTDGTPDGQVKKPPVPLKKSPTPSSAVGGLFSGLKNKMLSSSDKEKSLSSTVSSSGSSSSGEWDRIDGGAASKPNNNNTLVVNTTVTVNTTNSHTTFDHIERNTLLSDPRAGRVKAPRRRPPSQALRDDTPQLIGLSNGHEVPTEKPPPIPTDKPTDKSAASIAAEEIKPRAREWEKHRAPWMAELKLNQAKKTSLGTDPKARVSDTGVATKAGAGSTDRILDVGLEEKRSSHSMEMSKSTSSISTRMTVMESFEESGKVRLSLDSRKDVTAAVRESSREPEPAPKPALTSPTAAGRTITSTLEEIKKPAVSPPLASVRTSAEVPEKSPTKYSEKSEHRSGLFDKSTLEREKEDRVNERVNDKGSSLERRLQNKESSDGSEAMIAQLNNRISNLEKLIEVQNTMFKAAIEELTSKLKQETEKRQNLQSEVEKLAHCVTQV